MSATVCTREREREYVKLRGRAKGEEGREMVWFHPDFTTDLNVNHCVSVDLCEINIYV